MRGCPNTARAREDEHGTEERCLERVVGLTLDRTMTRAGGDRSNDAGHRDRDADERRRAAAMAITTSVVNPVAKRPSVKGSR